MAQTLTDQQIAELVGDLANYMGLPGPQLQPSQTALLSTGAQHPINPLTATLEMDGDGNYYMSVGGAGQRCILPDATGIPNPCTNVGATPVYYSPGISIPTNPNPLPRVDLVVGTATIAYVEGGGPGSILLGASFAYKEGTSDGAPLDLTVGEAAVAQIIIQPGEGPSTAAVQMVLPAPQCMATPPSGGAVATKSAAAPLMAVVVTAPPFNAPVVQGPAQQVSQPQMDAAVAINLALEYAGPGGAIYIPSGTYAIQSTIKTKAQTIYGGSGNELGQTIIFGGDVNFLATTELAALNGGDGEPALEITGTCTTIGTAKFLDLGTPQGQTSETESIPLEGPGNTYSISVAAGFPSLSLPTTVIIRDSEGNSITGILQSISGSTLTVLSLGELTGGVYLEGPPYGTIEPNAIILTPISNAFAVSVLNAADVNIDGILTDGWYSGVQFSGIGDSDIRSIRCKGVLGVGVQVTTTEAGGSHDTHFGSIYVNGSGGQTGVEIYQATSGSPLNALKFDCIEALGFNSPTSGVTNSTLFGSPPHADAGIVGTAVAIYGVGAQAVKISILFSSSCGNGLMIGKGVEMIAVADLTGGGNGIPGGVAPGYAIACCGSGDSTDVVQNVHIGHLDSHLTDAKGDATSGNGIYLRSTYAFHVDFAGVGYRQLDGVYVSQVPNLL